MMDKPDKKFELIREIVSKEDNVLSVTELCRIAGVSRSGYYLHLDHIYCKVGAMVSHPLVIYGNVRQCKPHLNGAFPFPQTLDMAFLHFFIQPINHFFQRLHRHSKAYVVFNKRLYGTV